MRIVRASELVRTPWKNGGGETLEIAVRPLGANVEDFDWRLSIADVSADGPFSLYAGVDRTLTLIAGDGMVLQIGERSVKLDPVTRTVAFAGEAETSARLIGGATRDFNVMTRRAAFHHTLAQSGGGEWAAPLAVGAVLVVMATADGVKLTCGDRAFRLDALDAALQTPGDPALKLDGPAILVWLTPTP